MKPLTLARSVRGTAANVVTTGKQGRSRGAEFAHAVRPGQVAVGGRAAPAIAGVAADVEPVPVVDGGDHRWRLGVGTRRQIRRKCIGREQRCNRRDARENPLHQKASKPKMTWRPYGFPSCHTETTAGNNPAIWGAQSS